MTEIVNDVLRDNTNRRVTILTDEDLKKKKKTTKKKTTTAKADNKKTDAPQPTPPDSTCADDSIIGTTCPVCGKGTIIKGKTAYGCSNWRNGCTYRVDFDK